jgi:hypothetical protein
LLDDTDAVAVSTFKPPLSLYDGLVTLTEGETVEREVLGSGDGRRARQSFELARKPLTHLPAPVATDPPLSTLRIFVDGIAWEERETFYGAGPNDRIFVVEHAADGTATVIFGDGRRGALLPTGTDNVFAPYRFSNALQQRQSIRETRAPLFAAALNPESRIGFVHPNVAGTVGYEDGRHALAGQFAAVRRPGVRVSGVSATPVRDARTPLFTADVITGRRGVESDAETLRAQARLTRRVDAVAELADDSAATAVVGVGRGVSTSRVPRVAGVTVRAAVDGCVDGRIDTDGSTHPRHALVRGQGTGGTCTAETARFADRALAVVVSACAGHEQGEHQGAQIQTINIRGGVSEEMTHFSGSRRSSWHAHRSPANMRSRGGLDG